MLNEVYFLELAGWITAVSMLCVSAVGYSYLAVVAWQRWRRRRA